MIIAGRPCITQVDGGEINSRRETFNTALNRITVLNVHKVDRNEIRMSPMGLNEKRNGLWNCSDTITLLRPADANRWRTNITYYLNLQIVTL